jgi:hypothetical protein
MDGHPNEKGFEQKPLAKTLAAFFVRGNQTIKFRFRSFIFA